MPIIDGIKDEVEGVQANVESSAATAGFSQKTIKKISQKTETELKELYSDEADQLRSMVKEFSDEFDDLAGQVEEELGEFSNLIRMALLIITGGAWARKFNITKENKTVWNEVVGEKILEESWYLKRLLSCHIYLNKNETSLSKFFLFAYFMIGCLSLPVFQLFFNHGKGKIDSPGNVVQSWNVTQAIFWLLTALIPPGLTKATIFTRDNCKLEILGALYANLEGFYGKGSDTTVSIKKQLKSRAKKVFFLCLFVSFLLVVLSGVQYLGKAVEGKVIFVPVAVMFWVFGPIGLISIVAGINFIILSTIELVRHTIDIYVSVHKAFQSKVLVVAQQETTKLRDMDKSNEAIINESKIVSSKVLANEEVMILQSQMKLTLKFLVDVMNTLERGWMPSINFCYTVLLAGYFLIIFYVYVLFSTLSKSNKEGLAFEAVAFTVVVVVSMLVVVQPLIAMATQAQRWVKVTSSCRYVRSQKVSSILYPNEKSPGFFMYEQHAKLQEDMTWIVMGKQMMFSALGAFLLSYIGIVWVALIVPAIESYVDGL